MKPIITFLLLFMIMSCSKSLYKTSEKNYNKKIKAYESELKSIEPANISSQEVKVLPSQNFNLRKPTYVVIHHTNQNSCEQTYKTFARKQPGVSSHYVICKDGTITQMLHDHLRGWHAGGGSWKGITDLNSVSLGIELDNNGNEEFSEEQLQSLLLLLGHLKEKYNLPQSNFIGHADLAPGRKVDPSRFFPWQRLAENGFGIWYDQVLDNITVPEWFKPEWGLKVIGYNTENMDAAIQSFQLHFNPRVTENEPQESAVYQIELSEKDIKIIWLLSKM